MTNSAMLPLLILEWTEHQKKTTSPNSGWVNPHRFSAQAQFGPKDGRGRSIGGSALVWKNAGWCARTNTKDGACDGWHLRVHATRSGSAFGASHGEGCYATVEAAQAAAFDKLNASRKRYVKLYGGAA